MDVNEVYQYVNFKLGKDQWGGYTPPDTFNLAMANANLHLLNEYLDQFERDSEITSDMHPMVKTLGDSLNPALDITNEGYAVLPDDYVDYARLWVSELSNSDCTTPFSKRRKVEVVNNEMFADRNRYGLRSPRKEYPVATIQNNKIYVLPSKVNPQLLSEKPFQKLMLTYIRRPNTPIFGYTIVDGEIVYDPATSVQLEWPEQVHEAFANIVVRYFAINQESQFNIEVTDKDKP